jgi:hypothetical protein
MALAAVGDKKGGHVVDDIGCPVLLRDGGHTNTNSAGTNVVSHPRGELCCSVETFTDSLVVIIVIVIITLPLGLSAVIGHGIVGKDIPIMARLAEARRWSKR